MKLLVKFKKNYGFLFLVNKKEKYYIVRVAFENKKLKNIFFII